MTDTSGSTSGKTTPPSPTPSAPVGQPLLTVPINEFLAAIDSLVQTFTDSLATLAQLRSIVQQPPTPLSVITPGSGEAVIGTDTWSLDKNTNILKNGKPAYKGWQSTKMVEKGQELWVLGLNGTWYKWNGNDFVQDANPGV